MESDPYSYSENARNYREQPSTSTDEISLPGEILVIGVQICMMWTVALVNAQLDLLKHSRTAVTEVLRLFLMATINYGTVGILHNIFGLMSPEQFQARVTADAMVTFCCATLFLLVLTLLHLVQFGYSSHRSNFGWVNEVFREDRFYVFVVIGFSTVLGLRLLACILKIALSV